MSNWIPHTEQREAEGRDRHDKDDNAGSAGTLDGGTIGKKQARKCTFHKCISIQNSYFWLVIQSQLRGE